MARKITALLLVLITTVSLAYAQTPPENEIWYTTTDGRPLFINSGYKESVGLYKYSDTYSNGRGVLNFKSGDYINFINSGLFGGKNRLKSITIPNSVTSIGELAFSHCNSLTSITIPNSVTSIGESAFQDCSSLKSFNGKYASSDGRCLIKDGELIAFAPEGLTSYTIPNSTTSIGDNAFRGCSSLTSITCLATTPPAISELNIAETTMIYVPKKAAKVYKKEANWMKYKKQIKPIKSK